MSANEINIKIYNDLNQDLKNEWLSFEKKGALQIFQKYYFVKNFIENKKGNFIFVVLSSNDKAFCILPFHINKKFGIKILQWIGTEEFDYCGPIIDNFNKYVFNEKTFTKLWKRILDNIKNIDFIFLNRQLGKINTVENPFVFYLKNSIFSKTYSIDLPVSYEEYIKGVINKKFLNEFQRTKTKLLNDNSVEFLNLDVNNRALELNNIIKRKIELLERKKIKHLLNEDMFQLFSKLKIDDPNSIKIGILKIKDEIIAANIGFIFHKKFYYYMPVIFSEKFNKFSPGKVLISYLIEWSINKKLNTFDFGLGDENYKKYWSNNSENLSRYISYRNLKGFACNALFQIYIFIKKIKMLF